MSSSGQVGGVCGVSAGSAGGMSTGLGGAGGVVGAGIGVGGASAKAPKVPTRDPDYEQFLAQIQARFSDFDAALFTTDVPGEDLWAAYLAAAPDGDRQNRTCHACKSFVQRFGGLVYLTEHGVQVPAFWPAGAPPGYQEASMAIGRLVSRARVTGVFLTSEDRLGVASTGPWQHLSSPTPRGARWRGTVLQTASQRAAERNEEYGMLVRGLSDFDLETVRKAALMLRTESLPRSEKHVEMAEWLLDLKDRVGSILNERIKENLIWRAAATVPAGWAHVRSGLLGTLLTDIASGADFEGVKRRFAEKIDPSRYLRPQAAPAAGNLVEAEKVVAKLGAAGALKRRFAKLSDVQTMWLPKPLSPAVPSGSAGAGGVFGHIQAKGATGAPGAGGGVIDLGAPAKLTTWAKFEREVLPYAESMELLVPASRDEFAAMVTAEDPAAPPILQWDREDLRNTVSWYVYTSGSMAAAWGLIPRSFHAITAVVARPSTWDKSRSYPQHGEAVCLVLEGAKDTLHQAGLALFPEILRSEYHGIRSSIEALSRAGKLAGRDEAEVCGLMLRNTSGASGGGWTMSPYYVVRVKSRGAVVLYQLDRWD